MFNFKLLKLIKLFLFVILLNCFTGCDSVIPYTNNAPMILSLTVTADNIGTKHNTIIICNAVDQDGDQITYSWEITGGSISGTSSMVAWIAPDTAGTYNIICTVNDGRGGLDSKSVTIDVFTLNQTSKPVVSVRGVNAATYHLSSIDKALSSIVRPDANIQRNGKIGYGVELYCDNFAGASGYKIYRSKNGENYEVVFKGIDYCCSCWCYFFDTDVEEGNIYFYYITAYGGSWETIPSEVSVIDAWLPLCSLNSPQNNEFISNSNITFTWSPVGLNNFSYGSICFGSTSLFVYDETVEKMVWQRHFDHNLIVSSVIYNDDGVAAPLISGHTYIWWVEGNGYDEDVNLIAISYSDARKFTYVSE